MEVEGELFYSPPHFRENEEGKGGRNGLKGHESAAAGEASLLLCLARERQISANLRKVLENNEAKLAASQRDAANTADAQDMVAITAEKTLLERRLQQEKRSSAELRRDLLTKNEENALYKRAISAGLKRLRDTIHQERWELGERGVRSHGSESPPDPEVAPEAAAGLLEQEIERLTTVCHLVQERQLRELRLRSQVDRSALQKEVESLGHAVAHHEVRSQEWSSEDPDADQHDSEAFQRDLIDARKALEDQRATLESKCQELERTRRDSSEQGILVERLQLELSKLQEAREEALVEMKNLANEMENHKNECSRKEAENLRPSHVRFSPKLVEDVPNDHAPTAKSAQESPETKPVSAEGIEDLFLLPHRPRPRPKSEAAPVAQSTGHDDQVDTTKVSSQPESHKAAERPRKKSKVLFQTPMVEVQESTVVTRTRSQTIMRTESSEINSTENKSSPPIQRRTRKINEVHD